MPVSLVIKKWPNAMLAALLLSCTLALFGPAQIFLTNSLEFQFDFSHLLPFLAVVSGFVFLLLSLLLGLLPERLRLHERGVAVTIVLALLLWLQGNLLVWQYGALSGQEIDWGIRAVRGLIDTPVWIAGLIMAAWRPGFLYRWTKRISIMFLTIQLLSASFTLIRQPEAPSFKKFQIDHTMDFDFSSRRNVILLILDSFQSDLFQEIVEQEPAFRDTFAGFTYFRNTLGGFPSTYASIPLLLTGHRYANSEPIQQFISRAYRSSSSVPYQLTRRGWRVDLVPAVQNTIFYDPAIFSNIKKRTPKITVARLAWLYDLTLFRHLPHFVKREIHQDGRWFLSRRIQKDILANLLDEDESKQKLNEILRARRKLRRKFPNISQRTRRFAIDRLCKSLPVNADSRFVFSFLNQAAALTERDVFKFYHWRGPHEPIQMNAEFEPVKLPLNRKNLLDLARGELKLVGIFLDGLREMGVFDRALIFILADHGHPWGGYGLRLPAGLAEAGPGGDPALERVLRSGIPLLLVKRPDSNERLRTTDAPATLGDVPATIFDELGLGISGGGEPLFAIPTGQPRERRFLHYSWEHSKWMSRYLPPLVEYRIQGHAWLSSSWQATGKVLQPGR